MLKFLLILALTVYILSKVGGFLFRAGASSQQPQSQQRRPDGKIHVDTAPPKDRKGSSIKGGDYVDYEEVK
jgi:hypothetical protein